MLGILFYCEIRSNNYLLTTQHEICLYSTIVMKKSLKKHKKPSKKISWKLSRFTIITSAIGIIAIVAIWFINLLQGGIPNNASAYIPAPSIRIISSNESCIPITATTRAPYLIIVWSKNNYPSISHKIGLQGFFDSYNSSTHRYTYYDITPTVYVTNTSTNGTYTTVLPIETSWYPYKTLSSSGVHYMHVNIRDYYYVSPVISVNSQQIQFVKC